MKYQDKRNRSFKPCLFSLSEAAEEVICESVCAEGQLETIREHLNHLEFLFIQLVVHSPNPLQMLNQLSGYDRWEEADE